MGLVLGSSAITITGLLTLFAANCIRNVEERLDRLERRLERAETPLQDI
jgi:hypothetical protein